MYWTDNVFRSPQGKVKLFEEIPNKMNIIFYPHFNFRPSYTQDIFEKDYYAPQVPIMYELSLDVPNFSIKKLKKFEVKTASIDYFDYGFWNILSDSKGVTGLSVDSLSEVLNDFKKQSLAVNYVKAIGEDVVIIFHFRKEGTKLKDVCFRAYLSNIVDVYVENIYLLRKLLLSCDLIPPSRGIVGKEVRLDYGRYLNSYYYGNSCMLRTTMFSSELRPFLKNVKSCIFNKMVMNNKTELINPAFVFLKNSSIKVGASTDKISSFLCWRRGGFATNNSKENDFKEKVNFLIADIYRYAFRDLTILDVRAHTYV